VLLLLFWCEGGRRTQSEKKTMFSKNQIEFKALDLPDRADLSDAQMPRCAMRRPDFTM
jgi:hypothetical protein